MCLARNTRNSIFINVLNFWPGSKIKSPHKQLWANAAHLLILENTIESHSTKIQSLLRNNPNDFTDIDNTRHTSSFYVLWYILQRSLNHVLRLSLKKIKIIFIFSRNEKVFFTIPTKRTPQDCSCKWLEGVFISRQTKGRNAESFRTISRIWRQIRVQDSSKSSWRDVSICLPRIVKVVSRVTRKVPLYL